MSKIEMNKIVYNELPIKNLEQLSYSIFQDENLIENEDKANECISYLIDNLSKVYEFIDTIDEDTNLNEEQELLLKDIDTYQIGDVINFLETIKIKEV